MRVAVIGGGPSGLVTLKYLTTAHEFFPDLEPIETKLFEAENSIGGTFKYRAYEDAEVHSAILPTSKKSLKQIKLNMNWQYHSLSHQDN